MDEKSDVGVNLNKSYRHCLSKLKPEGVIPLTPEQYAKQLTLYAYVLGRRTALVYTEAAKALKVRYGHAASEYIKQLRDTEIFYKWIRPPSVREYIERLFSPKTDRSPSVAIPTTFRHIEKITNLSNDLHSRFKIHKRQDTWCPYDIEFKGLHDMCALVVVEIEFLNRRAHQLQQQRFQALGLFVAISAIFMSTLISIGGLLIDNLSNKVGTKNSASTIHHTASPQPAKPDTLAEPIKFTIPGLVSPPQSPPVQE